MRLSFLSDIELIEYLKDIGQDRLALNFSISKAENRDRLRRNINALDFIALRKAFSGNIPELDISRLKPHPYVKKSDLEPATIQRGKELINSASAAICIMAGGMGSRLGFSGPKGSFVLCDDKSLFEILIDSLTENAISAVKKPYLLIMTSSLNNKATRDFFKERSFFNYPEERIIFFTQGDMPAVDESGQILMSSESDFINAPDGNGGIFKALSNGILDKLLAEGVEYLQVAGVDNVLLKALDPVFLGFASLNGADIASKSILKRNAEEKVGVITELNGRPKILEYSEISPDIRDKRYGNGDLVFADSNFAQHIFKLNALKDKLSEDLPFHRAHKKIAYFDGEKIINPNEPNAYKFEQFIFDIFPLYDKMAVLRVERDDEFAPLKNREGEDSILTAREAYRRMRRC